MTMILSSGAILSPAVKAELAEMLPQVKVVDRFGASAPAGVLAEQLGFTSDAIASTIRSALG